MKKREESILSKRNIKSLEGFYIEIRNKGMNGRGIRMRFNTKEDMERVIKQYESVGKEVIVLKEQ